jgi:hypothetical protein
VVPPRASRPHQITLSSVKSGVRYQVVELESGLSPGYGYLSPRDKPVVINVKGPSELRSNTVENLRVQIDGVPYPLPPSAVGATIVALPDPFTVPPVPRPVAPAAPKARSPR